ncbi:MAG: FHA domain-containing protein [Desulfobacterales bacterium]|nr:MAG: FHA domain-containing protein [Desulfobacterales bacterium]
MPTLTLKFKDKWLGNYTLQKGISLKIGRQHKNDVVIQDMAVSGHHAKIDSVGDGFVLIDLQSKNGSFVNEQLTNSHWLVDGDIINIGEHSLIFNYSDGENVPENENDQLERTIILDTSQYRNRMRKSNPTRSIINVAGFWDKHPHRNLREDKGPGIAMQPAIRKQAPIGLLKYLAGGSGEVDLDRRYTTIGKHPTSDIVIRGLFVGQTVVTIKKQPDGFHLCYVGGFTKPKVNQKVIKKSILLKHEDVIDIGSTRLQFLNGKASKQEIPPENGWHH